MRVLSAWGLALLLSLPAWQSGSAATGDETPAAPARIAAKAREHNAWTLPPVGFVRFCGQHPGECTPTPGPAEIVMSAERWRLVYRLNSFVNARIQPESDQTLYGEAEYWAYPTVAGDCEDYALLKQRYLERLGLPRSALLIAVVLDEVNEGHAVLMLRTREGDFVLDNRHNRIPTTADAGYTFLKRQSQNDPREWISLTPPGKVLARMTD